MLADEVGQDYQDATFLTEWFSTLPPCEGAPGRYVAAMRVMNSRDAAHLMFRCMVEGVLLPKLPEIK